MRNQRMMGPLGMYGIASSQVQSPGYAGLLDPMTGEPMEGGGGGGGGFSMGFGGRSSDPFHPDNFPTQLDPMAGPSYGLPSVWGKDLNTAETNAWANSMKTNTEIPQFMQNTFTDPMAERQGLGVYNMDFNNLLNRPAEQLTPEYAAAAEKSSVWRAARSKAQEANAQGGSGSSSGRGGRGNVGAAKRIAKSKRTPSPGTGGNRTYGGKPGGGNRIGGRYGL